MYRRHTINLKQDDEKQESFFKKLTLNKWSLTFAVMFVMLSAWLGLEEVDRRNMANMVDRVDANMRVNEVNEVNESEEVLYVTDTIPYDIQRVNAEANVPNNQNNTNNEENQQAAAGPDLADVSNSENYSINSDSDFFINYRLEREKARSRQLELLQSLIDDEKTANEMRAEAQGKVIEQAEAIEEELMLESILVAQYGGEAVVFIQPEKVNVVLGLAGGIADKEAEKIARLVDNYTGIGFENVIIVLKN